MTRQLIKDARDAHILARAMQEIAALADPDMGDEIGNDSCLDRIEQIALDPDVRDAVSRHANPPKIGFREADQ